MAKDDWKILFYKDSEGNEPVKDFILQRSDKAIAEILHVFKLLRDFNILLSMPYVRKINPSGLRELRIKHGSDIFRIFFFTHIDRTFILLHGIIKKTDDIPEGDIKLALKRMHKYQIGN
jgi:phage-related protein